MFLKADVWLRSLEALGKIVGYHEYLKMLLEPGLRFLAKSFGMI